MDAGILGALIGATAALVAAILAYTAARIQFRDQKKFDHDRMRREERSAAYHAFLNEAMKANGELRRLQSKFAGLSAGEIPDRATRAEGLEEFGATVHELSAFASSVALVGPDPVWNAARSLYTEFTFSEQALGMLCVAETDDDRKSCRKYMADELVILDKKTDSLIKAARAVLDISLAC
ncbi:hypothetical protein AB0H18_19615 [Streptomyces sp. NPDC020766]|uniref:hypothetical protein n=1 Tax=Streptomyces sp. NPDC020766 TaxID=3155011 RepID=UPI0033C1D555